MKQIVLSTLTDIPQAMKILVLFPLRVVTNSEEEQSDMITNCYYFVENNVSFQGQITSGASQLIKIISTPTHLRLSFTKLELC